MIWSCCTVGKRAALILHDGHVPDQPCGCNRWDRIYPFGLEVLVSNPTGFGGRDNEDTHRTFLVEATIPAFENVEFWVEYLWIVLVVDGSVSSSEVFGAIHHRSTESITNNPSTQ